jgi:phage FluMu gp28-like protein
MVRVGEPIPFVKNLTEKWIEVFGARIWFKSADKPDTLYGEDVYRLVGDEITRWKVDSWTACYSTLTATRGRAKLIGNVKGRRNFAYQLARKAEAKEQDWGYHKLTAEDAIAGGVIEADIVEQARRDLPEAVFNELYMADPSDDGGNPFGIDAIRAVKVAAPSTLPPVAYGLDLAKSQDWTVLYGLDAEGRECVFQRWQGPWRQTIQRVKAAVGRVPCLVDSTGVGDPVLEELQAGGGQNFTGYKFTSPSKQQLMEGLAVAIQKQEIRVASAVTIAELEAFEYEYTRTGVRYSAPAGVHDDCVMALALARQCAAEMGRAPVPFAFAG